MHHELSSAPLEKQFFASDQYPARNQRAGIDRGDFSSASDKGTEEDAYVRRDFPVD